MSGINYPLGVNRPQIHLPAMGSILWLAFFVNLNIREI